MMLDASIARKSLWLDNCNHHGKQEYVEKTVRRKRLRIIKPSDLKVPFEDALALLKRAVFMISDYG